MFSPATIKVCLVEVLIVFVLFPESLQTNEADADTIPDSELVKDLNERLTKRVETWGFKLEAHDVATQDNYILKVHRLLRKEGSSKPPVMIMHGIRGCSPNFLAFRQSVAYFLAEQGYDVWVVNARGTAFSMKHRTMKPSKRKFWDFSFHEIGTFDLPAVLKKIKEKSGAAKVHSIALSMGTTAFLVMAAEQPEVMKNDVASVSLMAPVACPRNHKNIKNKTRRVIKGALLKASRLIGRGDMYTYSKTMSMLKYKICRSKGFLGSMCEKILRLRSEGRDMFDHVSALEVLPFFPCGASIKSYLHFIQLAAAEKFQQYDYGKRKNQNIYHQPTPLQYDLGSIEKKIHLLIGGADTKAHKKDVEWLEARLKNFVHVGKGLEDFDHADFEYGTEISTVHKALLDIIEAEDKTSAPPPPPPPVPDQPVMFPNGKVNPHGTEN